MYNDNQYYDYNLNCYLTKCFLFYHCIERFKVIHNCKDIKLTKIKRQIFVSCITVYYKPS